MSAAARYGRRIPAVLSFLLLACQLAVPWTVRNFVTGDGPSHLYGAVIARDLIFRRHQSIYASVYALRRLILPNWTATVLLAGTGAIAGDAHAEQLFVSLTMLLGFLGFGYLSRALAPEEEPWSPVLNCLLQTSFLWMGFYNFYLGMLLLPWLLGYYIRREARFGSREVVIVGAGGVLLFLTHLVAAGIGIGALLTVAFWLTIAAPLLSKQAPAWGRFARVLASMAPAILLIGIFAHQEGGGPRVSSAGAALTQAKWALRDFPAGIFLTGQGAAGDQRFLWPLLLCYAGAGAWLLTAREWRSARGGLVLAALLNFVMYLFIPSEAFGGGAVSPRFVWAVFLMAALLATTSRRLRAVRTPVGVAVAVLLGANILSSSAQARRVSDAVEGYLSTARFVPGSAFLRLRYPASGGPGLRRGTSVQMDPFAHLDALVAVRTHTLDLTDYEPLTKLFPVVFRKQAEAFRFELWSFEGPALVSVDLVSWVAKEFPIPVHYVLLYGDEDSPEAQQASMPVMAARLGSTMNLIATSPDRRARIYRRKGFVTW